MAHDGRYRGGGRSPHSATSIGCAGPIAPPTSGRTRILQATALAITVWIVPILAVLRAEAPLAAAIHPVGAFLAFWLGIVVARGAARLAGSSEGGTSPMRGDLALVAVVVVVLLGPLVSGSPTET